jgi:hypothetical protein
MCKGDKEKTGMEKLPGQQSRREIFERCSLNAGDIQSPGFKYTAKFKTCCKQRIKIMPEK